MSLFSKKSIGLDIADHTIEAVEATGSGTNARVLNLGRALVEPGIVERGRIKDEEKLIAAVKEVFSSAKPEPIKAEKLIFGLPESQVYTHIFSLAEEKKKLREREIETVVLEEVQKNIPLEKDNLLYSYKLLNEKEILIIAASKEMVLEWQNFFQKLRIKVQTFDIETLAVRRAILADSKDKGVNSAIVDMGAATSNISIFDKEGLLRFSYSVPVAGDLMTQEIASALKVTLEEAERLKKEKGLTNPDEQVFNILVKVLHPLSQEIKTTIEYFKKNTAEEVKEIILIGGSSQLKGLVNYFKTNLDLLIKIADLPKNFLKEKETAQPLFYIEAIGLALRGLDNKWDKKDPALQIEKAKPKRKKFKAPAKEVEKFEKESPVTKISDVERAKKLRFQKILLIGMWIVGIIIIGALFWYRSAEKAKKAEELRSETIQYTQVQSFDLRVPVAANASEYTVDRARGRIIENTIQAAGDYNEAVANSRIIVEKELEEGERLWLTPVSPEQTEFPMTIKWLVYSDEDANKLFLQEIDKLNENQVDFALNNIEKTNVEATDNPNIFYLNGKVTLSLNELIQKQENNETTKEESTKENEFPTEQEETKKQTVIVQETPTGWLRVREKPGTIHPEIAKVYPGETYLLLEESEGWYKIELEDGQEGWIATTYASKE